MVVTSKDLNRVSRVDQVLDGNTSPDRKWFALDNNRLDGTSYPIQLGHYGMRFKGRATYAEYVRIPHSSGINLATNSITVQAWVYLLEKHTNAAILTKSTAYSDNSTHYALDQHATLGWRFRVSPGTAQVASSTKNYVPGRWVHVTGVYSRTANTIELYVDGELVDTVTITVQPTANTGDLFIGSYWTHRGFNGYIDDVRIWNRALTGIEVRKSMHQRPTGNEPGLVSAWDLSKVNNGKVPDIRGLREGTVVNARPTLLNPSTLYRKPEAIFDGVNDMVVLDQYSFAANQPWTASLFVKFDEDTVDKYQFFFGDRTNAQSSILVSNSNNFRVRFLDGTYIGTVPVERGREYHFTVVYTGTTVNMYIDGELVHTEAFSGAMNFNTIGKGYNNTTYNLKGTAREVKLWSKALSPIEVQKNMLGITPNGHSNLVGYWKLNEQKCSDVIDYSNRGNIGKFEGNPKHLNKADVLNPFITSRNVALGSDVTFDEHKTGGAYNMEPWQIVDGITTSRPYFDGNGPKIDLGKVYLINKINIRHFFDSTTQRIYNDVHTRVSEDGVTWYTIFNTAADGQYPETPEGKTHYFSPRKVRYIYETMGGSNANSGNHWTEIEAYTVQEETQVRGNIGIWGDGESDSNGEFPTPQEFTVWLDSVKEFNAIRVHGDGLLNEFPVDFTVKIYNGTNLVLTQEVTGNRYVDWQGMLSNAVSADRLVVSISKINKPYSGFKVLESADSELLLIELYSSDTLVASSSDASMVFNDVRTSDTLSSEISENSEPVRVTAVSSESLDINPVDSSFFTRYEFARSDSTVIDVAEYDNIQASFNSSDETTMVSDEDIDITVNLDNKDEVLVLRFIEDDAITAEFGSKDTLVADIDEDPRMTNIHTVMDGDSRYIHGRVEITYTDPFLDGEVTVEASTSNRGIDPYETTDTKSEPSHKWFSLQDNKLDGTYYPLSTNYPLHSVGWWGTVMSDSSGNLPVPETLKVSFTPRGMYEINVVGDSALNEFPVDFEIILRGEDGTVLFEESVVGNDKVTYNRTFDRLMPDVVSTELIVYKVNKPARTVKIVEFYTALTEIYDSEDIISMSVLEEQSYDDMTLPIGNVSANEIDIEFYNRDRKFDPGNEESPLYGWLKKNRRIRAWLGAEITQGEIEWHPLGVYWTQEWEAPESAMYARTVGYDRLELLRTTQFLTSKVYTDMNLYTMAEMILMDAGLSLDEFIIDDALRTLTVPYIWFERVSHRAALTKVAEAALGRVYCDREGRVNVVVYKEQPYHIYDYDYDKSIIDLDRPLALTQVTNKVTVHASPRSLEPDSDVFTSKETISLDPGEAYTETITFSHIPVMYAGAPILEGADLSEVDIDFEAFAWGMVVTYRNTTNYTVEITGVKVVGQKLVVQGGRVAEAVDERSVIENGEQTYNLKSDFIQTYQKAKSIADDILATYSEARHEANIDSRGNIALTLADRIRVPSKQGTMIDHLITQQTLTWMGSLEAKVKAQLLR